VRVLFNVVIVDQEQDSSYPVKLRYCFIQILLSPVLLPLPGVVLNVANLAYKWWN